MQQRWCILRVSSTSKVVPSQHWPRFFAMANKLGRWFRLPWNKTQRAKVEARWLFEMCILLQRPTGINDLNCDYSVSQWVTESALPIDSWKKLKSFDLRCTHTKFMRMLLKLRQTKVSMRFICRVRFLLTLNLMAIRRVCKILHFHAKVCLRPKLLRARELECSRTRKR